MLSQNLKTTNIVVVYFGLKYLYITRVKATVFLPSVKKKPEEQSVSYYATGSPSLHLRLL